MITPRANDNGHLRQCKQCQKWKARVKHFHPERAVCKDCYTARVQAHREQPFAGRARTTRGDNAWSGQAVLLGAEPTVCPRCLEPMTRRSLWGVGGVKHECKK